MFVREAVPKDCSAIVSLAKQLGYEVAVERIEQTLLERAADNDVFVAVISDAGVIGWIQVTVRNALLGADVAEIEGLVVEERYRSRGVGPLLLQRAREWAALNGCAVLRVRSNVMRDRAHGFYNRLGFRRIKTQHVFEERLSKGQVS